MQYIPDKYVPAHGARCKLENLPFLNYEDWCSYIDKQLIEEEIMSEYDIEEDKIADFMKELRADFESNNPFVTDRYFKTDPIRMLFYTYIDGQLDESEDFYGAHLEIIDKDGSIVIYIYRNLYSLSPKNGPDRFDLPIPRSLAEKESIPLPYKITLYYKREEIDKLEAAFKRLPGCIRSEFVFYSEYR